MKRCNTAILLVLLFGAASVSAATFTHPDAGYTVWYPDGWYVHKEAALIEPLRAPSELWGTGVWVVLEKRPAELAGGVFIASTIPADGYLGGKKILPEGEAELAVWREVQKQSCKAVMAELPRRLASGSPKEVRSVRAAGGNVRVQYWVVEPYAPWPVLYAFACKELAGAPFVLRIAAAGPGADREKVFGIIAQLHDSLELVESKVREGQE